MTDEESKEEVKVIKKVRAMNIQEKRWIEGEFEKGNALRFYRSSGTAVLTNVKTKDFEDLYYVPRDMIPEIVENPKILESAISEKKEKKKGN